MKFKELINFISDNELAFLEAETKVNHQVKKLDGALVFKLLLFSLLEHGKPSLRVMEEVFHSSSFRFYANKENLKTKYNSLSDRLSSINADFFEEIFRLLFEKFNRELGEETALQKYDSTMVAISSRLVEWGMTVGRKSKKAEKKQLKITIGLHGSLPCDFKIFHQQKYNCEDLTIPQVILNYRNNKSSIVTFDRGVQKRQTFVQFNEQNILFVTRIKTNARHHIIDQILASEESKESESLVIEQDLKVNFNDWETRTRLKTTFRLIKARVKSTGEMMHFVSNNFELTALEITEIYRKRWEIESFFRFIKQELNFSQLINRNLNGVKVMIYMTLILASLIIVYKKKNQLKGYKIVKHKITNEIQQELIREIVILSGGNPDNISYIFDD
jgi:K+/H+ antiporter YhaU regulatory subunit KhtT